jgi:hypothetical protein
LTDWATTRPKWVRPLLLSASLLVAVVVGALWAVGLPYRAIVDRHAISVVGGQAYAAPLPNSWPFQLASDMPETPESSVLQLYEDGRRLGPDHTAHEQIRRIGRGAYSHWGGALIFSTSDGSDPRSNGHTYYVVARQGLASAPLVISLILAGMASIWLLPAAEVWRRRAAGRLTRTDRSPPGLRTVFAYAAIALATWAVVSLPYGWAMLRPPDAAPGGSFGVIRRSAWYKQNAGQFDVVFLGDSRTYCGIHPELIDPLLGVRSINLAQFANWLPTQYPLIRDLVGSIPQGTTVVWSVGHQNFLAANNIQRVYPIDWWTALQYLAWRVPTAGLFDNVAYYNPLLRLWSDRGLIQRRWTDTLRGDAPLNLPSVFPAAYGATFRPMGTGAAQSPLEGEAAAIQSRYAQDPHVQSIYTISDGGRINSVVLYLMGGGYYRIELDPDYFRRKQRELAPPPMSDVQAAATALPEPDPGLIRLFDAILDQFAAHHVALVVNEIDEAPFNYANPILRLKWRKLMDQVIRPRVEARHFTYVRPDTAFLRDDDYFDYNHMNSSGSGLYAAALSAALRPILRK